MYNRYKIFTVTILKMQRAIQKIKTEEIAEYNLKGAHVSCIYYLYKENALTITELRDICGEDKSYVSHSMKYLEENGYVMCTSNAAKRYNAPFYLTDKGKEVGIYVAEKIDKILEMTSDGMSDGERDAFYRGLDLISTNLDRICENYEK